MPSVAISKQLLLTLDRQTRSVRQQIRKAIDLLKTDPDHTSLHREHYQQQADPRAQTIRINQDLRGVILKGETGFVVIDVLSHQDADYWMANTKANVNVVTGALEIIDLNQVAVTESAITQPADDSPSPWFGNVSDSDFAAVGVDDRYVGLIRMVRTQSDLDALLALLPPLQGDAVSLLAAGESVEDTFRLIIDLIDAEREAETSAALAVSVSQPISEAVAIAPGPPVAAPVATTPANLPLEVDLMEAAAHPASANQFAVFVEGDAALGDMFDQPWAAWRVFLHRSQKRLVERDFNGPAKVSGGPGTGKTVVAIHRAVRLAQQSEARILLTTYTTTLATDLADLTESLRPGGCPNIEVLNIDKVVSRILRESSAKAPRTATDYEVDDLFSHAANALEIDLSGSFLRQEWEQVVLAGGIASRADYFSAPRPGRGVRLDRAQRAQVWDAIDTVTSELARKGQRSFLQMAADAAELAVAQQRGRYDHIVVDEAQDLHSAHWKLLRAIVPKGRNDLFISADAQQRIYDRRVVLSRVGVEVRGRSSTLRLNYRSTAQIVRWAISALGSANTDDLEAGKADRRGYRSPINGPAPTVSAYQSKWCRAQGCCEWNPGHDQRWGSRRRDCGGCSATRHASHRRSPAPGCGRVVCEFRATPPKAFPIRCTSLPSIG